MDLASFSFWVCVMMVRLPGVARGDSCCPAIPPCGDSKPPPQNCFKDGERHRHTCNDGTKRQAGTSSLIKCSVKDGVGAWSPCRLVCIRDPHMPPTKPPTTTVTMEHTDTSYDSISTTTVTTSTSQQLTSASISTSVSALQTESTEPTSSGPDQWSLSDTTQVLELESTTVTSAGTCLPTSTSTLSPSTVTSNNTVLRDAMTGSDRNAAVCATVLSVIVIIVMMVSGIVFYRRRRQRNIPPPTCDELQHMNLAVFVE